MDMKKLKRKIQDEVVGPALNNKKVMRLNYFISNKAILSVTTVILDIMLIFLGSYLVNIWNNLPQMVHDAANIKKYLGIRNVFPLLPFSGTGILLFFFVIGIVDLVFWYNIRVNFGESNFNKGQKGTSRLTSLNEIKEQYKEVPERDTFFEGRGGMLISRNEDKCYIDNDPAHALILGITRSGKDELILRPMIEINSRAKEQPSMIIPDMKLENYKSTSQLLKDRGYDVYLLNLAFPMMSDGYDPLYRIKKKIEEGDMDRAEAMCAHMAEILFSKSDAVESENSRFFKINSTRLFEALVFAMSMDAIKNDRFLDAKVLPKWNELQEQYSLYSEMEQMRIEVLYQHEKKCFFEKHSEKNHIGEWQEYITKKMKAIPSSEVYIPCKDNINKITMHSLYYTASSMAETIVNYKTGKTKLELYFESRPIDDKARKYYSSIKLAKSEKTIGSIYSTFFSDLNIFNRDDIGILTSESTFDLEEIGFGDKPIAVFLGMADYDKTTYGIVSIFMSQVYYELSRRSDIENGECKRDVFMLFNEAGNCPAIPDLASGLTTCAGRRMYWFFFVQSLKQMKKKYKDDYETLFSNCGNRMLIKSGEMEECKEFEEMLGNETVAVLQRTGKKLSTEKSILENWDKKSLLTASQLMQEMMVGENIVIRTMHPYDNNGKPIKSYPIYNRYENGTQFKHAYKYLSDIIPAHKTISFQEMCSSSRSHITLVKTISSVAEKQPETAVFLKDLSTFSALLNVANDILGEEFVTEKEIDGDMRIQSFINVLMNSRVEKNMAQILLTILESGVE